MELFIRNSLKDHGTWTH